MRTYPEIARIVAISSVKSFSGKSFNSLTDLIDANRLQKPDSKISEMMLRIRNLSSEEVSVEQIIEDVDLTNPEILGQHILESWKYHEKMDLDKFNESCKNLSKKTGLSIEEVHLFILVNLFHALKIAMTK